ncbi:unnamed protein product [Adineta ricciae]|uniref:PDZ domain-containing protein n=1 Tax=Adineta ricciae TaxID=249248 RepID=A0A814VWC5_ADIRI|nr:unnamed protein product [Adineta ricciae]
MFSEQNSTTIQTRRTPNRNDETANVSNSQQQKNHRSLSGKFRNLFRKGSTSPNPNTRIERVPSPPPLATTRQRSPSPETLRTSTDSPLLRAPIVEWPFGKKKTRSPSEPSIKTKSKNSRKSKKKSIPTTEPTAPVRIDEYEPSIYNHQTYVPRTPEFTYSGTGRVQSTSSYETTTKGFRDYTTIENSKTSPQVITTNIDATTPPRSYLSESRRSPILDPSGTHYANIEYSRRYDTSVPSTANRTITNLEIIPGPPQQRQVNSTIQNLTNSTPTLPQIAVYPSSGTFTTDPNQWRLTSTTSFDNNERYSASPTSVEIDAPKLHAPAITLGSKTSKTDSNETYHSTSNLNKFDKPIISTYSALSDTDHVYRDNFTPTDKSYPWLSAIVQHHMRPLSSSYNSQPWTLPTNPYSTHRFDASTTTFRGLNSQETSSPLDGYIRPLTPSKSSVQPDVSVIHIDPQDDYRSTSRTAHITSSDIPITYRSSATIYTRDKQNFNDGGEIRTWSPRDDGNTNSNQKSSTSIFIERAPDNHEVVPIRATIDPPYKPKLYGQESGSYSELKEASFSPGYEYERRQHQQYFYDARYYSSSHFSDSTTDDRTYTRSPLGLERDTHYDRSNHFYKDANQTQASPKSTEPAKNPDLTLRHYTLKRTDSYNGLGIVIATDAETRLNHRIRDVEPSSPGCRIGLRKNDRIVNVNGVNVENLEFGNVLMLIKDGLTRNKLEVAVINEAVLI